MRSDIGTAFCTLSKGNLAPPTILVTTLAILLSNRPLPRGALPTRIPVPTHLDRTQCTTSWTILLMFAMKASHLDKANACGVCGHRCVKGNDSSCILVVSDTDIGCFLNSPSGCDQKLGCETGSVGRTVLGNRSHWLFGWSTCSKPFPINTKDGPVFPKFPLRLSWP